MTQFENVAALRRPLQDQPRKTLAGGIWHEEEAPSPHEAAELAASRIIKAVRKVRKASGEGK